MTTHFASIASTGRRAADVAVVRLTTAPAIDAKERKVDEVLADSFPASDPPPWTFGRAARPPVDSTDVTSGDDAVWSSHSTEIISGRRRTAWQWIGNGLGAMVMGMVIPIAILAIGIPVVLAARVAIEAAGWLMAALFN